MKTSIVAPFAAAGLVFALGLVSLAPRAAAQDALLAQHEALMKRAGNYEVIQKFSGPGAPPSPESKGTSTLKSTCGGRFLLEENTGSMMGQPVTGVRLIGFHTGMKRYEASWVYSMSTSILQMTGTSEDGGKTVKLTGEISEGTEKMTLRVEYHFVSDDSFVVKLFSGAPGEPGPVLEETYTRKK